MLPPRRVVGAPRVANKPTAASSDKPSSLASDSDVVIFYYFLCLPLDYDAYDQYDNR